MRFSAAGAGSRILPSISCRGRGAARQAGVSGRACLAAPCPAAYQISIAGSDLRFVRSALLGSPCGQSDQHCWVRPAASQISIAGFALRFVGSTLPCLRTATCRSGRAMPGLPVVATFIRIIILPFVSIEPYRLRPMNFKKLMIGAQQRAKLLPVPLFGLWPHLASVSEIQNALQGRGRPVSVADECQQDLRAGFGGDTGVR